MPRGLGEYDHMNEKDPVRVPISFDHLAGKLEKMNYGTHRFLSALVRARRARKDVEAAPLCRMLTDAIEEALNKGGF